MEKKTRRFPIQLGWGKEGKLFKEQHRLPWVWWEIAEQAYKRYAELFGADQSLERMAERGGFGVVELDWLLSGRPYRQFEVEDEPFERAGNTVVCERCGLEYSDHPYHPRDTFLTRLCDGRLVKL